MGRHDKLTVEIVCRVGDILAKLLLKRNGKAVFRFIQQIQRVFREE